MDIDYWLLDIHKEKDECPISNNQFPSARPLALGLSPSGPNLTARFAQDAKDAKKIFLSNREIASQKEQIGSLRFDKTFDPAGATYILNVNKIFAIFAVQGF